MSNWILVDDTDSQIQYSGPWRTTTVDESSTSVKLNDITTSGTVWNNTVHEINSNGSIASFEYNGTGCWVYGSWLPGPINPQSRSNIYISIDGQSGDPLDIPQGGNNIWFGGLGPDKISPGKHELVMNITVGPGESVFLDYMVYEDLPSANRDGEVVNIGIGNKDHSLLNRHASADWKIEFGSGWAPIDDQTLLQHVASTTNPGASVTLTFNGTAIQLYGGLTSNGTTSTVLYQLDDHGQEIFTLVPPNSGSLVNQQLLNLSALFPGEHKLAITYNGSGSSIPLNMEYFLMTSLTLAEQASLTQPSPSPSPMPPLPEQHSKAAIIGGTIGGVVFLVLIASLAFLWFRRRDSRSSQPVTAVVTPLTETSQPSFFSPYNSGGTHAAVTNHLQDHSVSQTFDPSLLSRRNREPPITGGNSRLKKRLNALDHRTGMTETETSSSRRKDGNADRELRMSEREEDEPEVLDAGDILEIPPPRYTETDG
ncbi:hypothetical protein VKT23_008138 [Stygiomarasmius scandens]|uniref:Transmembrane protein n=1 Tax=Marasmiellus scandens TaxID=2682957 RepID=A0ABR1JI00_9AGAR